MIDDPLEWLAVVLDDEEPTIPDVNAWSDLDAHDETLPALDLDDEGDYTLDLRPE